MPVANSYQVCYSGRGRQCGLVGESPGWLEPTGEYESLKFKAMHTVSAGSRSSKRLISCQVVLSVPKNFDSGQRIAKMPPGSNGFRGRWPVESSFVKARDRLAGCADL